MKKTYASATFLLAVAGTMVASAQTTPPEMAGSDTLEEITKDLLDSNCRGAANAGIKFVGPAPGSGISYVGGGSGAGGNAIVASFLAGSPAGSQVASPQSRALSKGTAASECDRASNPASAQGVVLGLDAVVVVGDQNSEFTCGGGFTAHATNVAPANNGVGQNFADMPVAPTNAAGTGWKDILRILYTGYNPATGTASGDCKASTNAARANLANNYVALFEGGCTDASVCPGGIKHAYRRNDLSGTTDTFLNLIGAPAVTRQAPPNNALVATTPFCNGKDTEDRDPIRRNCTQDEQVCEYDGTLGLVLPVLVPTWTQEPGGLYNAGNVAAQNPTLFNRDPAVNGDVEPSGSFVDCRAPICKGPPNPIPDPGELFPVAAVGVVGYNLPVVGGTQQTFAANNLRCDCRYPIPNDYAALGYPANHAFDWNVRVNGKCTGTRHTFATGSPADRYGVLNGDNGTTDNSPAAWGNKIPQAENGVNKVRCCRTTSNGVQSFTKEDPRVMNLFNHDPIKAACECAGIAAPCANDGPAPAFYRIHSTPYGRSVVGIANTTPALCQDADATRQIGCLVQKPNTCSVGYAGREAAFSTLGITVGDALAVGGTTPSKLNIQALIDSSLAETAAGRYQLSRRLFYNTLIGFNQGILVDPNGAAGANPAGFGGAEFNLYKCFADQGQTGNPARPLGGLGTGYATSEALAKAGFIELPAFNGLPAGPKLCNDMCGANNACAPLSLVAVPAADLLPAFAP